MAGWKSLLRLLCLSHQALGWLSSRGSGFLRSSVAPRFIKTIQFAFAPRASGSIFEDDEAISPLQARLVNPVLHLHSSRRWPGLARRPPTLPREERHSTFSPVLDFVEEKEREDLEKQPSPSWRDYLHLIPEWPYDAPPPNITAADLPVKVSDSGYEYRDPVRGIDSVRIVDNATFEDQKRRWNDAEMRDHKSRYWMFYGIPPDHPLNAEWIPDYDAAHNETFLASLGEVVLDDPQHDFIIRRHDSHRNYSWEYTLWNPDKNNTATKGKFRREYALQYDEDDEREFYDLRPLSRPMPLDNGTWRQPPIEDLVTYDFRNEMPWMEAFKDPSGDGDSPEPQNFWQTDHQIGNTFPRPHLAFRKLGQSSILIPEVGIGAMTFGFSTDETQSHKLIDYAFDKFGVNFIDTAEVYPFPARPSTFGVSEKIVGSWLSQRISKGADREDFFVATKVAGRSKNLHWVPRARTDSKLPGESATRLSYQQIKDACDSSLIRLQTSHIDLFQFHWPDRYVPDHGSGDFSSVCYDHTKHEPDTVQMSEQLHAIKELLEAKKVN
eukprot:GHVN01003547.1.p1 GENE.GHVN01003547.1~~GHVN01003547.1.p1  ORF type:complete len:551 (+),score=37.82 GHVN01003547.1:216-1868(+)